MNSFLWPLDDVRIDQGIPPTAELPFIPCPRCGIDVADFVPDESHAHATYHQMMDEAPKSIYSQEGSPVTRMSRLWAEDDADRACAGIWRY